jgi:hypothetical protein
VSFSRPRLSRFADSWLASVGAAASLDTNTGGENTSLEYGALAGWARTTLQAGSENILIGVRNAVDTPASNTSNFFNIGNTIFGTSVNTGTLSSPAGKVGIDTLMASRI